MNFGTSKSSIQGLKETIPWLAAVESHREEILRPSGMVM